MRKVPGQGGFTLIELLVVIGMVSFLASIVLVSVSKARNTANKSKFVSEINSLRTALLTYKDNHGDELPECAATAPGTTILMPCWDRGGSTYFDEALQPLVLEKLISKIPHYPGWPASSMLTGDWSYSIYLRGIYDYAGVTAVEFSCDPVNYSTWTQGSLPGIILITTNQDLPYKKGYTQCDTGAGACINLPFEAFGTKRYCLPLSY